MKLIPIILALGLLSTSLLHAQFIAVTGTNPYSSPYDFECRSNGILIAIGSFGGGTSLGTGDQGASTRLLWYPKRAAFRAGRINTGGTNWDDSNIGNYSAAFGADTLASGVYSFAVGNLNTASGNSAFVAGYSNQATGTYATALGYTNLASGNYAIAFNYTTTASGNAAASFGDATQATAFSSVAIGRYNVGLNSAGAATNATGWTSTDPVFEIGNGTATTAADAVVVYKNGTMTVQGVVTGSSGFMTTAASITSTDIPMFGH